MSMRLHGFEEEEPETFLQRAGVYTVETGITKDSPKALRCAGGNDGFELPEFDNETQYSIAFHFYIVSLPGAGERFGFIAGAESPSFDENIYSQLDENGDIITRHGSEVNRGGDLVTDKWYVYICHWTDGGDWYHEIREAITGDVKIAVVADSAAGGLNDFCAFTHDVTSGLGGSQSAGGGTVIFDNLAWDTSKAVNLVDSVIGSEDYIIHPLLPNAAGDVSDASWSGDWTDIDEIPTDDGTTSVSKGGGSQADLLANLQNSTEFLKNARDIKGVTVWLRRLGIDSGSGGMTTRGLIKTGGSLFTAGGSGALSWTWIGGAWDTNPATASAWTLADIDALQAGVRGEGGSGRSAEASTSFVYVLYVPYPRGGPRMILSFIEIADRLREWLTPQERPTWRPEPQILTPTNLRRAA